jgi:hypothetical protein
MEDDKETEQETRLDVKLQIIMKRYEPVFIAFFLEEAENMEGVIFEIGCICCKYGKRIRDRLMLLSNKNYDWDKRTPYMNNLIPRVTTVDFDEHTKYRDRMERKLENLTNSLDNLIYCLCAETNIDREKITKQ